jgi:hypothetical protein
MSMDGRRVPADHGRGTEERSKVDRAQTGRVVRRKLSNRHDATITVKSLGRVSAHNWRLADRNRCVDAVSWQPSSVASAGRPVVCLDVVPQQKVAVRQLRGDMRTFARRGGGAEAASVASLKLLQRTRRGGRLKKETRLRGGHRLPPLAGPSPPLLPDLPSPSLPAQGGRRGQGPMLNHRVGQLTTQRPSRSTLGTACASRHTPRTILRPSLALRHPCRPINPRHPYPQGGEGGRERCSTGVSVN